MSASEHNRYDMVHKALERRPANGGESSPERLPAIPACSDVLLETRLATALGESDSFDKNCIGTALFLVGLKDSTAHVERLGRYARSFEKIDLPETGCVAVWECAGGKRSISDQPEHMAVVVSADPAIVAHRPGCHQEIVTEPLASADASRRGPDSPAALTLNFYKTTS